jgi:hypothetical protein
LRFAVPRSHGHQHLVRIALPPVVGGEDLHLVHAAVARRFHPRAQQRKIDHAVAHHATIVSRSVVGTSQSQM